MGLRNRKDTKSAWLEGDVICGVLVKHTWSRSVREGGPVSPCLLSRVAPAFARGSVRRSSGAYSVSGWARNARRQRDRVCPGCAASVGRPQSPSTSAKTG